MIRKHDKHNLDDHYLKNCSDLAKASEWESKSTGNKDAAYT